MAWLLLGCTILLEVAGTTMMKLSRGLTELWPSIAVFACYGAALTGIAIVLRHIELSIAYAIWSGVGTALTALIGIAWFKEPLGVLKIVSLALVIVGIVGLKLAADADGG